MHWSSVIYLWDVNFWPSQNIYSELTGSKKLIYDVYINTMWLQLVNRNNLKKFNVIRIAGARRQLREYLAKDTTVMLDGAKLRA